jgi:hypothetical protein
MIRRWKFVFSFIFITNIFLNSAFSHEIYLNNGKIVKVKNYWENGDSVCYEKFGATISIPKPDILKIVREESAKEETNTITVNKSTIPSQAAQNNISSNSTTNYQTKNSQKYIEARKRDTYEVVQKYERHLNELKNLSEKEWGNKYAASREKNKFTQGQSLEEFKAGSLRSAEKFYLMAKQRYDNLE